MATRGAYTSWNGVPASRPTAVVRPSHAKAGLANHTRPMLAYGNGRSYGDSCLNNDGLLVDMRGLDRFIEFDPATGELECEPGVLLDDILQLVVPQGWFVPVTPGTRFVTVGGAIANDVHGKNHHRAGTFGHHVQWLVLQRSNDERLICGPQNNADWFAATVGGLGLTGLIMRVRLRLRRIAGPYLDVATRRFANLDDFFKLSTAADADHEYTVAWVDCSASGRRLGRGWFMAANHKPALGQARDPGGRRTPSLFFTPPMSLINQATLKPLNTLYYRRGWQSERRDTQHYRPFFYPLDGVRNWNRAYGRRGFFQYQCVVPHAVARASITELLERIATANAGSFLSVLKVFGDRPAPGMLSFARPGVTLALDFANNGCATRALLDQLDETVMAAGGAVYPAKDARMSPAAFERYFPNWRDFAGYVDPAFSSGFWRRVTEGQT